MRENWDRAIANVLVWEAGYADRPEETVNHGVTLASWREFHPNATKQDIKNLTEAQAAEFFKIRYAGKIDFDGLPSGMDAVMLHGAIMFGVSGVKKMAEKAEDWKDLLLAMSWNKMRREETAWRFMKGWQARFEAIHALATELARGGRKSSPTPTAS